MLKMNVSLVLVLYGLVFHGLTMDDILARELSNVEKTFSSIVTEVCKDGKVFKDHIIRRAISVGGSKLH